EQARLLKAAGDGDKLSQDRLVAAYLPTVVRLAAARGQQSLSIGDLVQEGSIGLLSAVRDFTRSGEPDFVAFAEERITAQLSHASEAEAAAVRDAQLPGAAADDYARTEAILRKILEREPPAKELAAKLEWTLDRLRYVANVVKEARRRHDEELLAFIDPAELDLDEPGGDAEIDPTLN